MAHIKVGDEVVVLVGPKTGPKAVKGKSGKVKAILKEKNRAVVEGLNMLKKAVARSAKNPQGGIIEMEGSIHVSNLMKKEEYEARRAKKAQK